MMRALAVVFWIAVAVAVVVVLCGGAEEFVARVAQVIAR